MNHKDKNPSNNCADNLEWCDCQYNIDYSRSHQVAQIDLNSGHIIRVFVSVRAAARFLKKSKTAILEVANYLTYGKLNQHKSKEFRLMDMLGDTFDNIDDLLAFIISFEGLRLKAYKCPAGVWTIGAGRTKGVKEGMTITREEAIEF